MKGLVEKVVESCPYYMFLKSKMIERTCRKLTFPLQMSPSHPQTELANVPRGTCEIGIDDEQSRAVR